MKKKNTLLLPPPSAKESRIQVIDPDASYGDQGVPLPGEFDAMSEAYSVHVWVYAAVWAIASNLAGLEWKAWRKNSQNLWEEYLGHPWETLLENPNPYLTGYNLREFTYASLELTGNAYWILERGGGDKVKEIWPVPSSFMRAVVTPQRFVDHYVYEVNGKTIDFAYNEVIHFRTMNPNNPVYGQGSLQAAKVAITQDFFAQAWNKWFYENSARPDAALKTDQTLSDDVRKRVLSAWNSLNRGPKKRGKTALLEGGLEYQEINRTPKDVDFVEGRKLSREEILAAFGVPPALVGVLEYANYSNVKEQKEIFWKHTLMPKRKNIDTMLTMRVKQLSFDPKTIFQSDVAEVDALKADLFQLSQTTQNFYRVGIPLNQIIEKLDLPFDPVDGGDEPLAFGQAQDNQSLNNGRGGAGQDTPQDVPPPAKSKKAQRSFDKTAHWKKFDSNLRINEEPMEIEVRSFFRGQRRRVIAALEKNAGRILSGHVAKDNEPLINISLIFDSEEETKRMRKVTDKFITRTFVEFATRTARNIDSSISFSLSDPKMIDFLAKKQLKLVREVTDTTKERLTLEVVEGIKDAVAEGLKQGDAVASIADRIDDFYQLAVESRSAMIARTESASAANAGIVEGMKRAGVEYKRWLDSQDDKVRDSHRMDDQVVRVDENFITNDGNQLAYPGDSSGPAEEVINCRCTSVAVLEDQENPD